MRALLIILFLSMFACKPRSGAEEEQKPGAKATGPQLMILGTLQDGGSPHIGCKKKCCRSLFTHPDPQRKVVSLGIFDKTTKQTWLFEATPDITTQLRMLSEKSGLTNKEIPDGIFITHAHIGHYAGLMYLGREAMDSKNVKVYAMPRFKSFLENSGPWSQLLSLGNISLEAIKEDEALELSPGLKVTPIRVPHRDEFSETVGFIIEGPRKKVLFIPDIDKWAQWNRDIREEIKKVDLAFIDGTFYDGKEVPGRNISEIPHPFVSESTTLLQSLPQKERQKVWFIHFNHTNPLLYKSHEADFVLKNSFHIAKTGQVFAL